jgi:hypothetical protein
MEPESRAALRFWLKASCVLLAILIVSALFSAYLQPGMLVSFEEVMAFCAALLR